MNSTDEEEALIGDFSPIEVIVEHEKIYKESKASNTLTDNIVFTYAWHLIKSQYKNDIKKGIKLMGERIQQGKDQRDYYYIMALGHYKLEEFGEAKNCVDRVLQMEPRNYQAKLLKDLVSKKMITDNLITLGVVGGVATAIVVGGLALIGAGIAKALAKK